jgi:hypothetical protein
MKKIISCILAVVLVLSNANLAFAQTNSKTGENISTTNFEEIFENENGQEVRIVYDIIDENRNNVEVYIDDILTQKVQSDVAEDILQIEYLNKDSMLTNNQTTKYLQKDTEDTGNKIETYRISDFIVSTDTQNSSNNSLRAAHTHKWTLYKTYQPSPILSGSKTCSLYQCQCDASQGLHRYNGKQVKFGAGTAVGIIASLLATFLTGGVTIEAILIGMGTTIVSDAISRYIEGDVCFSTQKTGYAPKISGSYVWTDAYITKRWVVVYDAVNQKTSYKLSSSCHDSNRGQTPENIAFNAQVATM